MSILHGKFYNHFKYIRTDGDNKSYEARVPVLMMLISASDKRLQVWHGIESIMNCTGYSKTPVIEALSWLQKSGAIYNVPKGKRIGRTAKLHANRKVWQLTGLMKINDEMTQYLLLKEGDIQGSLQEIQEYAPKVSIENETIIGLQDGLILDNIGLQSDNNIGLQSDTTKELGLENLVTTLSASKSTHGETSEKPKEPLQEKVELQSAPKLSSQDYDSFILILNRQFKLNGGRAHDIYHQLRGSIAAKKKKMKRYEYGQLFRDKPVSLFELQDFPKWFWSVCDGCELPISADGLEDWFGKYRREQKAQANRPKTLFQQKLPTNYDMLDKG